MHVRHFPDLPCRKITIECSSKMKHWPHNHTWKKFKETCKNEFEKNRRSLSQKYWKRILEEKGNRVCTYYMTYPPLGQRPMRRDCHWSPYLQTLHGFKKREEKFCSETPKNRPDLGKGEKRVYVLASMVVTSPTCHAEISPLKFPALWNTAPHTATSKKSPKKKWVEKKEERALFKNKISATIKTEGKKKQP